MLDIILQILPVLGIILLVLLCIIILFLLLVLFFPISYKISGKKDAKAFSLAAGADWLFGLLRVRYAYPEPGRLTVKLLWIMLYDSGTVEHEEKATDKEKTKDKSNDASKEKINDKTNEKAKDKTKEKANTDIISVKRSEDYSDIVSQTTESNAENAGNLENVENLKNTENTGSTENTGNSGNTENTENAGHTEENKSTDAFRSDQSQEASEDHEEEDDQDSNWISGKIEKIKFTISSAYDKIKKIWENISYYVLLLREEETHLLFSHVMKRLGRVFRNIQPRKLRVNVLFGTGAPDTTGYAYGVYSMLSSGLGSGVIVTPDFERAVLEGDFDAAGTITSAVLAWHFLRLILDKKLWRFIDKLKKGKKPVETSETGRREENAKQGSIH